MLEKIRENSKGLLSWGIVILIGVTFAMWGVSDYFTGSYSKKYAAKINGEKLTWREVEMEYERARRQRSTAGLSEKDLKDQVRSSLIQKAAILSSIKALGFRVGEEQLAETIIELPFFQVDGKFSKERYLEMLNSNGFTDLAFRQEIEQELLLNQLEGGLIQSNFSLPNEVNRVVELFDEKRNFGFVTLTQEKFRTGIELTKEDKQAYYEKHKNSFVTPEQASIEYVELSLDQIAKQQAVTDEELQAYYKDHLTFYSAPERVHARHILIAAPEAKDKMAEADKEADEKAKAKIEDLLAKIKQGEDFSALAKANSDDKGSATKGGDLGWFTRGQMVPVFDKAVFALNTANETTGPIRTQFGYHLIQLIEHKQAETRSFQEVKDLVLEQVQREKALAIFIEKSEQLSKLAFEKNNSLAPLAEELGLKIQKTGFMSKGPSSSATASAASAVSQPETEKSIENGKANASADDLKVVENPFVIAAAFSEPVLKQKNNSEPIQVGEYDLVVIHLNEHKPATQQSFEEATKKIEERLLVEKGREKVKELAESMQKRIQAGENPASLASNLNLTWNMKTDITRHNTKDTNLNKDILAAVFKFPHLSGNNQDATKALPLANGDYAILMLYKVTPGSMAEVEPAMQSAYQRSVSEGIAQLEYHLFANQVLTQARIEVPELE